MELGTGGGSPITGRRSDEGAAGEWARRRAAAQLAHGEAGSGSSPGAGKAGDGCPGPRLYCARQGRLYSAAFLPFFHPEDLQRPHDTQRPARRLVNLTVRVSDGGDRPTRTDASVLVTSH